jgi:hypothetical protein
VQNELADHHARVAKLRGRILTMGNDGDTLARAIERLGDHHPLVKQYDAAVRSYRRAVPWNAGVLGVAGERR